MRVQEVLIENNNKRYILLDQEGFPVLPVMKYIKYIKYLDKTGKSPNTQKTYCYSLKHFFTYLDETNRAILFNNNFKAKWILWKFTLKLFGSLVE